MSADKRHFGNMHGGIDAKNEWLTPPQIIKVLGEFDLDPADGINMPWKTAHKSFTIKDNGLMQKWFGRVWLNPPYGNECGDWARLLSTHGNGIMLTFARPDTKWFHEFVFNKAEAILFIKGRLKFHHIDGTPASNCAGAPSCLIAYGEKNVTALEDSGLNGFLVYLK